MANKMYPAGWLKYSKMGQIIKNSNIIPIKTPTLKTECIELGDSENFTVQDAIDMVEQKDRKVGMVINLCFTDVFYDITDFTNKGVSVKKICVPGQTVPDGKYIKMFCDAMVDFEKENRDNKKIVLVHCTHGINRAGFLICSYLIKVKGIDPNCAVESFEKARGHKMVRQDYVQGLIDMKPSNKLNE